VECTGDDNGVVFANKRNGRSIFAKQF